MRSSKLELTAVYPSSSTVLFSCPGYAFVLHAPRLRPSPLPAAPNHTKWRHHHHFGFFAAVTAIQEGRTKNGHVFIFFLNFLLLKVLAEIDEFLTILLGHLTPLCFLPVVKDYHIVQPSRGIDTRSRYWRVFKVAPAQSAAQRTFMQKWRRSPDTSVRGSRSFHAETKSKPACLHSRGAREKSGILNINTSIFFKLSWRHQPFWEFFFKKPLFPTAIHTKTRMLFGQHFGGKVPINLNHVFLRPFEHGFSKKIGTFMFKNQNDGATLKSVTMGRRNGVGCPRSDHAKLVYRHECWKRPCVKRPPANICLT